MCVKFSGPLGKLARVAKVLMRVVGKRETPI